MKRNATEGTIMTQGRRKTRAVGSNVLGGPRAADKQVLDVTVLMGGPSTEREVSLVSGAAVADALERLGHRVTRADITPQDTSALDRPGIDVVFIVLHGAFGESGDVQQLCEQRKLRYTGSPTMASRLSMDKIQSKKTFRLAGLVTPDWAVLEASQSAAQRQEMLAPLALPLVLKPIDGGSSVDIFIVSDESARDAAAETLVAKYGRCMAERFVKGRELTVGILGDEVLPVIEIIPARKFYDYEAKYADGMGTRYNFEHGLSDELVGRIQADALKGYQALGCRDLSRLDFILDDSMTPQVLEINTIPGFTSHSLLPKAAQRVGISFDQLCERIVRMAMGREG